MPITVDSAGNPTITGDGQSYTVTPGARNVTVAGNSNTISGGTGPSTYLVTGDANGITTGSGPAGVIMTDTNPAPNTTSGLNTGDGGLAAFLVGSGITLTANLGALFVRGNYTNSSILVNGSNTNSNAYIIAGGGNVLQGSVGNDTIYIATDNSLTIDSAGTDTYVVPAGTAGTTVGPRLGGFAAGQDHLAILVNPASGLGMSDLNLAPMSFLTAGQFERSAAPTTAATRFTYDPATGQLSFTPRGSVTGQSLGVARLPPGLNLQANEVFIANQFVYGAPTQTVLDVTPGRSGFTTAVNPEGNGAPVARFAVTDTTTGLATSAEPGQVLVGDPNGLVAQFIYTGSNVLAVAAQGADNVFIKSNSTAQVSALQGGAGNDVLDGGLGSVFLTGGAGRDFFFTDARQSQFVWTTVTDFQPAEIVTLWGFQQGRDSYTILPREGAAGSQGVTLEANVNGATARITLSARTQADFAVSFGQNAGGNYLAVNSIMV